MFARLIRAIVHTNLLFCFFAIQKGDKHEILAMYYYSAKICL